MKKVLKNKNHLTKLPLLFLIIRSDCYSIREYYFSGKYTKYGMPLVYYHDTLTDTYYLRKITDATTEFILTWTFYYSEARILTNKLNTVQNYMAYVTKTMNEYIANGNYTKQSLEELRYNLT